MEPTADRTEDTALGVHDRPVLRDHADQLYSDRYKRTGAWVEVVNLMYPDWDGAAPQDQKSTLKDVKTQQSVQDCSKKRMLEEKRSGRSPKAKKCPYFKELQFLLKTPELRRIQGNISPTNEEDIESQEESQSDGATDQSGSSTLQPDEDGATSSLTPSEASIPQQSGGHTVSRPAARSHSATRTPGSQRGDRQRVVVEEALSLIKRINSRDQWDHIGAAVAEGFRGLPHDRQMHCASVVFAVIDLFSSLNCTLTSADVIMAMRNAAQSHPPASPYDPRIRNSTQQTYSHPATSYPRCPAPSLPSSSSLEHPSNFLSSLHFPLPAASSSHQSVLGNLTSPSDSGISTAATTKYPS
ncbi:uncharacterized protein [Phyllobates terribilis]|uniref:uncharacterized protein n=1 Tax=Phyllobates terribilis TaxID=111132 RepID=UPI003CCB65E5